MKTLFCIHGFLGQASDWKSVLPSTTPTELETVCFDLFRKSDLNHSPISAGGNNYLPKPENVKMGFHSLAEWINTTARGYSKKRVLVGYSLGGRIALHALISEPTLWSAAVVIAAHPGLENNRALRETRTQSDSNWAQRIEKEEWEGLIADWNSQPVLKTSNAPPRCEKDFCRAALADAMRGFSLGRQEDLRDGIHRLQVPTLWMVGEGDLSFLTIAQEMAALNPNIKAAIIPGAFHRAPWDNPSFFQKELLSFLNSCVAG